MAVDSIPFSPGCQPQSFSQPGLLPLQPFGQLTQQPFLAGICGQPAQQTGFSGNVGFGGACTSTGTGMFGGGGFGGTTPGRTNYRSSGGDGDLELM